MFTVGPVRWKKAAESVINGMHSHSMAIFLH